jgi:hypothetical protein
MDLSILAVVLDMRGYNSFSIEKICTLVGRFYPVDFYKSIESSIRISIVPL